MDKKSLHDTGRFVDPLGDHIKSIQAAQSDHIGRYPSVDEVYFSCYQEFLPNGKEGERFLGSSDGVVGTVLSLRAVDDHLGYFSYDGRCIAEFENKVLAEALEKSWNIRCLLAYSTFSAKEKVIKGTAVCFCFDPVVGKIASEALNVFIDNIIGRVAHGAYLKLRLSQEQFVKVIESKGQWYLLKEESWPKLSKGTVYYRRRRTLTDRLIDIANSGNKGCLIASWVGMFAVIGGIALLVWFFFFR
jgi:hypothetical protein